MAENSLFPAYVVASYHSVDGAHLATIPTREWSATPLVPGNHLGSYTNWLGFPCDGETMIIDLFTKLAKFMPSTTIYDTYTVYTLDTPTSPAIPRASFASAIPGSSASPGWSRAVQRCWFFRDEEWHIAKIYQLDSASGDAWNPTVGDGGNADAAAIAGAFTSTAWAWSSRNGVRPQSLMRVTTKLNDKLRAEYNMD